jgi:hypothetical protein
VRKPLRMAQERSQKVKRFAELYCNGPEKIKGNWQKCEQIAKVEVAIDDAEAVAEILTRRGASLLNAEKMARGLSVAEPEPERLNDVDEILDEAPDDDAEKSQWCALAKKLEPVIEEIAEGTVKASAAQAATIRHILDRCYGRVQERESDLKPSAGVVVLPMLGTNSEALICPRCMHDLRSGK